MNSNELRDHIRRLNELELQEHERRKQIALNKIKQLREQQKREDNARVNTHQRDVIPQ